MTDRKPAAPDQPARPDTRPVDADRIDRFGVSTVQELTLTRKRDIEHPLPPDRLERFGLSSAQGLTIEQPDSDGPTPAETRDRRS